MRFLKNTKGQSTFEYTFIFIILMTALLAMGLYIKRGIQGRWREAADQMGDQYSPGNMSTGITYVLDSNIESVVWTEDHASTLVTLRNDTMNSIETKKGQAAVQNYKWP